jgi:hypothetical protein
MNCPLKREHSKLPADAEGRKMRQLRREMHERLLGNGYCTRPPELDCRFESICESCTFFATTIEFRPTLERQRDDAAAKGQHDRRQLFDQLLTRLDPRGPLTAITHITLVQVQRHRLLGHRGPQPLDLLPGCEQRGLLR